MFCFKKRFRDTFDLINTLYSERIGVLENQDLYDDINKNDIQTLKKQDLIREIRIQEKKTKDPHVVIYSKNYQGDYVDSMGLEKRTPQLLKDYWKSIDKDMVERTKKEKASTFTDLNKMQNQGRRKNGFRKDRLEGNVESWENRHLSLKIEEALKQIETNKAMVHPKLKKIKKT